MKRTREDDQNDEEKGDAKKQREDDVEVVKRDVKDRSSRAKRKQEGEPEEVKDSKKKHQDELEARRRLRRWSHGQWV